jgi:hypothetical protein
LAPGSKVTPPNELILIDSTVEVLLLFLLTVDDLHPVKRPITEIEETLETAKKSTG